LATDGSISRNPACAAWLTFLAEKPNEHATFYAFLTAKRRASSLRFQTLIQGAETFAVALADFLVALPESLQNRFAYLYGRRLHLFFGKRTDSDPPNLAPEPWTHVTSSWAAVLGDWIADRAGQATTPYSSLAELTVYMDSIEILRPVWTSVRDALAKQEAAVAAYYAPI
jgi:hypothetical protein